MVCDIRALCPITTNYCLWVYLSFQRLVIIYGILAFLLKQCHTNCVPGQYSKRLVLIA